MAGESTIYVSNEDQLFPVSGTTTTMGVDVPYAEVPLSFSAFDGSFETMGGSSVYPNPVAPDGLVTVEVVERSTIQVFALNGKLLQTYDAPAAGTVLVDLSSYAGHVYMVSVTNTNGNNEVFKLVK